MSQDSFAASKLHDERDLSSPYLNFSKRSKSLFALVYSVLFVLFPWEYLLGFTFPDKLNYIATFHLLESSDLESINPIGGILGALVSESLWALLLFALSGLGLSAEQALLLISFFSLSVISNFVFSKVHLVFAAIFLLNPLIVDFVMAQQRSALAFSIFLQCLNTSSVWVRFLLVLVGSFVHLAFLLLIAGFLFSKLVIRLRMMDANLWNRISHLVITFCFAILVLLSKEFILGAIDDRRASAQEGAQSLTYAFFWFLLICYVYLFSQSRETSYYSFAALFVSFFLVAVVLKTYSSRFLVFAYPFLLIALSRLPSKEQFIGFYLLLVYQSIQWVYWWGWFTR